VTAAKARRANPVAPSRKAKVRAARRAVVEPAYSYDLYLYYMQGDDFASIKGRSSLVTALGKWAKDMEHARDVLHEIIEAIYGYKVKLTTASGSFVSFQAEDAAAERVLCDLAKRQLLKRTRIPMAPWWSPKTRAPRKRSA
jgi:hypothetical protein